MSANKQDTLNAVIPRPRQYNTRMPGMATLSRMYGDKVADALANIDGASRAKKRRTLILLAAAWLDPDKTINSVYGNDGAASKFSHRKWLDNDPLYKHAYDLLIGTADNPGEVRKPLDDIEVAEIADAVSKIRNQRLRVTELLPAAIEVLAEQLEAEEMKIDPKGGEHHNPDNAARLRAARLIVELNLQQLADHSGGAEGAEISRHIFHIPSNNRNPELLED